MHALSIKYQLFVSGNVADRLCYVKQC